MKKKIISISSIITLSLPVLVLADNQVDFGYLDSVISSGRSLLNDLVILLFALAIVWFIWNVVKYAMSSEEDGKDKAKSQMINGIIAIAVMASVWGIVALLRNAFGVENNNQIPPSINNMIPSGSQSSNSPIPYRPPSANQLNNELGNFGSGRL